MRLRVAALQGDPAVGSIVLDSDEDLLHKSLKGFDKAHFVMLLSCDQLHVRCQVQKTVRQLENRQVRKLEVAERFDSDLRVLARLTSRTFHARFSPTPSRKSIRFHFAEHPHG